MPLTLLDFVEQVERITVEDIPNSAQDSINDELNQQTGGGGQGDISNPSDARIVADTVADLNGRAGFTSIQDAIDGASPKNGAAGSPVGSDGTIFVEPATYPESITLGTDGVTIQSTQGSGETTVNSDGTNIVDINADDVTLDGFTVEAGNNTTAVNIDDVSDGAAVTLTNNVIDLTAGDDSSAVGIATGSGSGINETIENNTFQANPDNFLGGEDTFSPVFVGDSNRVDFGAIQSENAFEPGVVEYDTPRLSAAVSVTSNDEFLQALTDDRDVASGFRGGPFALSENYINGLDSDDGQSPDGRGTTAVKIDQADINTGNSINLPSDVPGDEGIAAAIINVDGFDTAQFVNGLVRDGTVDVLVPDRADNVTIALGNFNPVNDPSGWSDLSGDNFVIRNVTL